MSVLACLSLTIVLVCFSIYLSTQFASSHKGAVILLLLIKYFTIIHFVKIKIPLPLPGESSLSAQHLASPVDQTPQQQLQRHHESQVRLPASCIECQ